MSEIFQSRRGFIRGAMAASGVVWLPTGFACSGEDDDPEGAVIVPEWQQMADGLEESNQCCWSRSQPATGQGAGGVDPHVPNISVSPTGLVTVSFAVDHPMTSAHWISTIYVRDQSNLVIGLRDYGQSALLPQYSRGEVPGMRFQAPPGTTRVQAYAYCNLHQHWAGDVVNV